MGFPKFCGSLQQRPLNLAQQDGNLEGNAAAGDSTLALPAALVTPRDGQAATLYITWPDFDP